jgi:hypothetical protein
MQLQQQKMAMHAVDRYRVLVLLLNYSVAILLLPTCSCDRAPLYEADDADAVRGEYLVVFREEPRQEINCSEAVRTLSALWAMRGRTMTLVHSFHIKHLEAALVRTNDTSTLDSIRDMPDVVHVEANRRVKAHYDIDAVHLMESEGDGKFFLKRPAQHRSSVALCCSMF